jgi:hypothetical protein
MSIAGTENFDDEHHEQHSVAGGGARLVVTQEGTLDPSLLIRTEGYMYKKGGAVNARGGFRNWKKRYFVLAPVDFFGYQGYELQYYDAPNGTLKGTVALNDVDLYVDSKSANKKVKFEFQLILQNGGELQLSCDTDEEREEWVKTLQVIVDFLHKVATQPAMMLDGYDPMMEDDAEVFQIGDELAQNCQAFGPGLFGSEAGKSTQFVINLHDIAGQRVTKGGMPIVATISNEDSLYYLAVLDNDDGSYYCNYVLGTAGKYHLSITLNEEHHIFGSPFDIEILPSKTVPKFCVAEGDILQQMATKSTGTFMIYAMDGFGNRKTRGGDPFEVSIMGPGQVIDLEDRNDGSYACTITTTNVQQQAQNMFTSPSIMIMVTLYGKSIENSPFKPVMVDGTRPQSFLSQAAANQNMSGSAVEAATNAAVNRPSSRTAAGSGKEKAPSTAKPGAGANDAASETASQRAPSSKQTAGAGAANAATAPLTPRQQPSSEKPLTTPQPSVAAASSTPATVTSLATHSSLRTPPPPPGGVHAHDNFQTPSTLRLALAASSSSQQQQQQPTAATPTTDANLAGLSRLERSRQRALLAKSIADQNTHGTGAVATNATNVNTAALSPTSAKRVLLAPPASSSAGAPSAFSTFSSSSNAANEAASPATSVKPFSSSAASTVIAGGRLAQLAARSKMTLEALKAGNAPPSAAASTAAAGAAETSAVARGGPPPSSSSSSSHQHHQLQQELLRHLHGGLGSATAPPSSATTAVEQRLWQRVHAMLTNDAQTTSQLIRQHLLPHIEVLWQLFTLFGDRAAVDDANDGDGDDSLVLRLASAQGYGGLMKLLEVYEVLPHFLTRLEVKMIFNLCLTSQVCATVACALCSLLACLLTCLPSAVSVETDSSVDARWCGHGRQPPEQQFGGIGIRVVCETVALCGGSGAEQSGGLCGTICESRGKIRQTDQTAWCGCSLAVY